MKIKICNKCKGFNYKEIMKVLDNNFNDIEYTIGCNNMCGIGRSKIVVIKDNKPIVVDTIDDLINKIKKDN